MSLLSQGFPLLNKLGPRTQALGVEIDCPFTPAMLRKIAYAGSQSSSFVHATQNLSELAEVAVTAKRVERWTKRVGQERTEEVEAAAEAYQSLALPEQQKSPVDQVPQVACVMVDGGRIQIRDRRALCANLGETTTSSFITVEGRRS